MSAMPARDAVYEEGSRLEPFQVLTAEHALLRLQLSRALDAARHDPLGSSARKSLALLYDGFRLHQRREDLVMVPACERLFGGKDGAASVLREDHMAIREAFATAMAGPVGLAPVALQALENLRALLEAHFAREERVLFPLMTAHLAGREASDLARRLRTTRLA